MSHQLPLLPEQHLSDERRDAGAERMAALVNNGNPRSWPRRRRLAVLAGGTAVLIASGGTAAALHLLRPTAPTNHETARCYSTVSTDFSSHFPGTTIGAPHAAQQESGRTVPIAPIDQCSQAWANGLLSGHLADPNSGTYPVPPLVGCILPDGTAAVFPGQPGLCTTLGLADALPG